MEFQGPIIGFIIGVLLIVFRERVAKTIERIFKKFPVYEKSYFGLTVKPVNVVFIGIVCCCVAVLIIVSQLL